MSSCGFPWWAQVVSEDVGLALDKIDIEKLGSAKKVPPSLC
jgi:hypothetical protein